MDAEKTMFAGSDQATYNSISKSEQQPVSKSRNGSRNKLGSTMGSEADLLSASNIDSLERAFRRKNFAELPFMSTFGMTTRESAIKKTMSMEGISSLGIEAQYTEEDVPIALAAFEEDEAIMTYPLLSAVIVSMISQFLVGYNTSVMNAPQAVVFPHHTIVEWSLAVSAFAIGGPFGAIAGGYLANVHGRKRALLLTSWVFICGGLLMGLALNVYWLIPARFLVGFASGLSSVIVPVYLGEISPPSLRGTLGTCTQFAMVIGILVSSLVAFPLATPHGWRYLFLLTPALCVLQLLLSSLILESPRWLLNTDPDSLEARHVIRKLRGFRHESDVDDEVNNFISASILHKTQRGSAHSGGAMWDLCMNEKYRVLLVAAIGLQMSQQLCGINAVFYYSTAFFDGLLENPLLGTCLVNLVNVVATFVAMKLMDHAHRRTLLLWSSGGMLLSALLLTASSLDYAPKIIALFAVMLFVTFFEIGLGPIPWLITTEYFNSKYVATAMSISCIVNWGCNFLVGLVFPYMHTALKAYTFVPFAVMLGVTFLFTLFYVTESYGKTADELFKLVNNSREIENMIAASRGGGRLRCDSEGQDIKGKYMMIDKVFE
mmetsp:Transcript_36100/g.71861  ORF Transcript_36100/g.71861 Transcript_36100/m.71861 type:complete len:603 (-) Transcript_36100:15-1823(-)